MHKPSSLLMPLLIFHFQGATPPLYIGSGQDEQKHDDLDDEALTVSLIVIILIVVWSRRHVRTNCSHSLSTRWCVKKIDSVAFDLLTTLTKIFENFYLIYIATSTFSKIT